MASLSKHNEWSLPLQGGAVLGVTVGLAARAAVPQTAVLVVMGIGALAFALWFRESLWPLITRTRFYESFFGIPGPGPLTYIKEGVAAGIVAGGAVSLLLAPRIASWLVWVGLAVLVLRYGETLRCLLAMGQGTVDRWRNSSYRNLLARVHGDRALAERLIAYEARYAPNATREELAESALARLQHDSR